MRCSSETWLTQDAGRGYEATLLTFCGTTVTLKIADDTSKPITLRWTGTPQGLALSPFLLNITLLGRPGQLGRIPNLNHALYVDNATLWTGPDSLGGLQGPLQLTAQAVNQYAKNCGMLCSPQIPRYLWRGGTEPGRTLATSPSLLKDITSSQAGLSRFRAFSSRRMAKTSKLYDNLQRPLSKSCI